VNTSTIIKNQRGFSLIEILIVLGLIAGIVAMIAQQVGNSQQNAMVRQTKLMMSSTMDQLELYNADCQSYPTTAQGLAALMKAPGEGCENWGPAPYAKKEPKDAWGNAFNYESDGTEFEIISYGKNKRPGGEGADADISSNKLDSKK